METVESLIRSFSPSKPILLVDADEVLLKFIERLETFFLSEGFELRLTSFQLAGNTYNVKTGEVAEPEQVRSLIGGFFDVCVDDMSPVEGAADGLAKLSERYQIAVLSNVPANCRERREKNLKSHGIPYPVIANKGNKGPAVKIFDDFTHQHTVFVDDLPPQHSSVADHSPDSHRVHFIADNRLANMIGKAPDADVRIDCWDALTKHLLER